MRRMEAPPRPKPCVSRGDYDTAGWSTLRRDRAKPCVGCVSPMSVRVAGASTLNHARDAASPLTQSSPVPSATLRRHPVPSVGYEPSRIAQG